ncbi:hypothetical protein OGAPHI_000786 [Ogataea philodendri]|uniref:GPI transamidase component PIG-S n=1 Tax=Ogataea philodendri TaxID=1378263 RepID=A0A9P8TA80_9ASCO|nr:uncharacterized protein OGAPHI_000786 [Ogataea philodendri]KAH3671075.1 hypothetical protein OGAPHI_000786 [Ogataea philodendri]
MGLIAGNEVLTRRRILLSILAICAFVGLPLWYATTTVQRAELPVAEIYGLSSELVSSSRFEIPVYVQMPVTTTGALQEAQQQIDDMLKARNLPVSWRIVLEAGSGTESDYKVHLFLDQDADKVYVSPFEDRTIKLYVSPTVIKHNKVAELIARTLVEDVFGDEITMFERLHQPEAVVKMPYSPDYHVTLSLLQGGVQPIGWDIESSALLLKNYLSSLAPYANFTFDSQVEHYEKLSENIALQYDEDKKQYLLKESDTSTFIDYSEWGLDQNTQKVPVVNFLAYVPAPDQRPIQIENSVSNSFIVPQWGGVAIVNTEKQFLEYGDLLPVMEIFASQLFQLVGAPGNPKSPTIRTDILTRFQSVANTRKSIDNLISLCKLCEQLPNISVPDSTREQVEQALKRVREAADAVVSRRWSLANALAAKAYVLSDKAFFQKDMVQQMYFPEEHKMAVYTPLLGPFATIMVLGVLRMLKEARESSVSEKNAAPETAHSVL